MKQPTKPNKNKDIVTIGDEWTGEERPSYICNFCSRNLVKLTDRNNQTESYYCYSCGIDFNLTMRMSEENLNSQYQIVTKIH